MLPDLPITAVLPDIRAALAQLERKQVANPPPMYSVWLLNDDYTPMEFVVEVLQKFFHKDHSEALHIMLSVHHKGHAVVGVYTRDVAETKTEQTIDYARANGHPLRVTCEPE